MNFFFGQLHVLSIDQAEQNQQNWLNKTIFAEYKDRISTHIEPGFSLTLINDPKNLALYQSKSIYIDDDFVCATDCQLFNKTELALELQIDFNGSNEEFFITAYQKWGNLFPDKFDGKFSFILWDRRNNKLLGGRDALGYGEFCYSQLDDNKQSFFFSSDMGNLLDCDQIDKSINYKRLYQCLDSAYNTPEQSYFEACNHCPPGHVIEVDQKRISSINYWNLHKKSQEILLDSDRSYARQFIELLTQAIDNEVTQDEKNGLMLSGGRDSSLLAAIIAENHAYRTNLTCYTIHLKQFPSCNENVYANMTTDFLNLNLKLVDCDKKLVFSDFNDYVFSKELPCLNFYVNLQESIYKQAKSDGCKTIITGQYGDFLFSGGEYLLADFLKQKKYKKVISLIAQATNKKEALLFLLNYGIRQNLPDWIKRIYRKFKQQSAENSYFTIPDQFKQVINQSYPVKSRMKIRHTNLLNTVFFSNTHTYEYHFRKYIYLVYGMNICNPYYSKKIIEFIWILPNEQIERPCIERYIQVMALKLYNLHHIADRKDKTSFQTLLSSGINKNMECLVNILKNSELVKNKIVEDRAIWKVLADDKTPNHETGNFARFILTDLWLQLKNEDISYSQHATMDFTTGSFRPIYYIDTLNKNLQINQIES